MDRTNEERDSFNHLVSTNTDFKKWRKSSLIGSHDQGSTHRSVRVGEPMKKIRTPTSHQSVRESLATMVKRPFLTFDVTFIFELEKLF